jgi:putative transcriptional regulator
MNRVSRGVIAGLKEAIAHARGEISLPARYYNVPGPVDVKRIRAKSGLSQSEFARRYGFSVRTLQDWELGRTQPPSAVRAYLTVIHRFPGTVEKALKGAA